MWKQKKKQKCERVKKKLNFCKNQPGQKISARPGEVVTMSRMVIRLTEKWKKFFLKNWSKWDQWSQMAGALKKIEVWIEGRVSTLQRIL